MHPCARARPKGHKPIEIAQDSEGQNPSGQRVQPSLHAIVVGFKPITRIRKGEGEEGGAGRGPDQKVGKRHPGHARRYRDECANRGQEAAEEHRQSPRPREQTGYPIDLVRRQRQPTAVRRRPASQPFQADPTPVLDLLELLKDDPALYVRRSVANNLNDIGKDHPELLTRTTQAWLQGASPERAWIVNHALRSAVKRGEAGALKVLGYGQAAQLAVGQVQISPGQAVMGSAVQIGFALTNTQNQSQRVLVDLAVHYVKANGQTRAKVFKLTTLELAPGQTVQLSKKLSLAEMTTRKHYPGVHPVAVLLNGQAQPLGAFELVPGG